MDMDMGMDMDMDMDMGMVSSYRSGTVRCYAYVQH